jgi:glycosyltransferase involved in cell wall biosynthesis
VPWHVRLLHQWHKRTSRKIHFLQIEPTILKRAARRIEERFARGDCDAVFSPGTGVPVYAYVSPTVPVFSYLDASKLSWIRTYFGEHTLCARSRQHVREVDRVSFSRNRLTIFSSEWATDEAMRDYGLPASHFAVVPFGANLAETPIRSDVEGWIAQRSRSEFRLFFLGKEWERKGGPEALALVRELNQLGVPAKLDIVGCKPPPLGNADARNVRLHGFIDHSQQAGREKFRSLLEQTHVLVFLSRAEAFGIALCEAAAFGVPAFAAPVGGIPTIVRDGVSGWFASSPFDAKAAATTLAGVWREPERYARIALGARKEFENRLNWDVTGRSLQTLMENPPRRAT